MILVKKTTKLLNVFYTNEGIARQESTIICNGQIIHVHYRKCMLTTLKSITNLILLRYRIVVGVQQLNLTFNVN